jgi:hypothetical protein
LTRFLILADGRRVPLSPPDPPGSTWITVSDTCRLEALGAALDGWYARAGVPDVTPARGPQWLGIDPPKRRR